MIGADNHTTADYTTYGFYLEIYGGIRIELDATPSAT
jgi:hypothetical protein